MATAKTSPKRVAGGKFAPGASGNPGGRRTARPLGAYIRAQSGDGKEIIDFLLKVMRGEPMGKPGRPGRVPVPTFKDRLRAAHELLERAYGRAPVSVEIDGPGDGQSRVRFTMDIGAPPGSEGAGGDDA